MKINRFSVLTLLLCSFLASAVVCPAARAQDEEEDSSYGHLFAEMEAWVAQPAGLEYSPATEINPTNPFDTSLLTMGHGTELEQRFRAGYELSGNKGGLAFTWYGHRDMVAFSRVLPGDFRFGETLAHPLYAGFANDGLADGFDSEARTLLRDMSIGYYRTAFETPRVSGKWVMGWRRVRHDRYIEAEYSALIPGLPPLIPPFLNSPRPDLDPGTDRAEIESSFEGRGVNAGMEFRMPLWKDKLVAEGGFSLAVLRGKTDAAFRGTNYYYLIADPVTGTPEVLSPPYDEFGETELDPGGSGMRPVVDRITQDSIDVGLKAESRSTTAQVMEANAGFRWEAWRGLAVFGGFRSTRYTDVGVDLRPKVVVTSGGTNIQDVTEVNRSATYEGFYGGIAYRF